MEEGEAVEEDAAALIKAEEKAMVGRRTAVADRKKAATEAQAAEARHAAALKPYTRRSPSLTQSVSRRS